MTSSQFPYGNEPPPPGWPAPGTPQTGVPQPGNPSPSNWPPAQPYSVSPYAPPPQSGYPNPYPAQQLPYQPVLTPGQPARSRVRFIIGIILTVIGSLFALSVLSMLLNGTLFNVPPGNSDAAYLMGRLIGMALTLAPLIIGISMIRANKPRPPSNS